MSKPMKIILPAILIAMILSGCDTYYYDCSKADKKVMLEQFQQCVSSKKSDYDSVGDCKTAIKSMMCKKRKDE